MRLILLALAMLSASIAFAEKRREIPLKEIWAERISGTKDIRSLQPAHLDATERGSHVQHIRKALGDMEKAGPAFFVPGTGAKALEAACSVLTEKKKRDPAGEAASLFFYVLPFTHYVALDEVERNANEIVVKYHFVSHATKNHSMHFALIPVGRVADGCTVRFIQLPVERGRFASNKPIPAEAVERVVCRSITLKE